VPCANTPPSSEAEFGIACGAWMFWSNRKDESRKTIDRSREMTRRSILVLALAGALAAAGASAQTRITSEKIADGVWAAPTPGGSNVGWFDVGGVVVAVDAGANEDVGRAVVDEIQKTTGKKPRYVVLTHAHRDHAGGAGAFAAAGAQVVCAEKAASGVLFVLEPSKPEAPSPVLMTVSERLLLVARGSRRAEVYFLGPGHTQGDLVVLVPDAGILFSGDLAVNGVLPYMRSPDVDPEGWEKILPRLAALRIDKLVPGHGTIGPREGISDTATYVARVNQIATKIVMSKFPEPLWEAQVRDPVNEIPHVKVTPDHIANVRAVAQRQLARQGATSPAATPAAPATTPAAPPATSATPAPTPQHP